MNDPQLAHINKKDRVPLVCIGLGGTKIEIGVILNNGVFQSSGKFFWRQEDIFKKSLNSDDPELFTLALVCFVKRFLDEQGLSLTNVEVFGVPFPGPSMNGKWFSNNLVPAFRKGVEFEKKLKSSFQILNNSPLRCRFHISLDAMADAGGEIYHPKGRLRSEMPTSSAMVLNLATGIAAGFILDGRVLTQDFEFRNFVNKRYDAGSGQLGRHLLYNIETQTWTYKFCSFGQTPELSFTDIRMTDYLSGPAIATRFLYFFLKEELLNQDTWPFLEIPWDEIEAFLLQVKGSKNEVELVASSKSMRQFSEPFAGIMLAGLDKLYFEGENHVWSTYLNIFVNNIAKNLADALNTWRMAPGWGKFADKIILTGGVGINFLASSDGIMNRAFDQKIIDFLPNQCRVERSELLGATERESYLYLYQ